MIVIATFLKIFFLLRQEKKIFKDTKDIINSLWYDLSHDERIKKEIYDLPFDRSDFYESVEKPILKTVFSETNWSERDIELFKKNMSINRGNINFLKKYIFSTNVSSNISLILDYIEDNPMSINDFYNLFETIKNTGEIINSIIEERKYVNLKGSMDEVTFLQQNYKEEISELNVNISKEIDTSLKLIKSNVERDQKKRIKMEVQRYEFSRK